MFWANKDVVLKPKKRSFDFPCELAKNQGFRGDSLADASESLDRNQPYTWWNDLLCGSEAR